MAVDSSTKPDGDVDAINAKHLETLQLETIDKPEDYEYTDVDKAPELHMRTYIALASMLMLNMAQLLALQGPPAMVTKTLSSERFQLDSNIDLTSLTILDDL